MFVLCHEASFSLCKATQQFSGAALLHNGSQVKPHGRALWGVCKCCRVTAAAMPNWGNCSALFNVILIHGEDNPGLTLSHTVKCLSEGWGKNINVPSSTSALALRKACGEVTLRLLCTSRTCCSWDKGVHMMHHLRKT